MGTVKRWGLGFSN